ncbi:cell division protein ZipA [Arhodomonas sp. AD133]|uniref:cell division protein ZipA n=1 Tax=Arhodomonas sp. AD133 TaxID=3415009 RepID=UPI003EBE7D2D
MDELRWLLIILGALAIVAIYLHGTIQNWRHDGPPWSRRRREQREPFADHDMHEPHLDDELDVPPASEPDDELNVGAGEEPLSPLPDDERWPAADEPDEASDGFPAWARSRVSEARSPAEDWPVPSMDDPDESASRTPVPERETAPADEPAADQQDDGTPPRWSPTRVSQRLREALRAADDAADAPAGTPESDPVEDAIPPGLEERIVVINVMAPEDERFVGAALVEALRRAGLEHGEHGIFHRYLDIASRPVPEFSVANILNPGWFDLERIDEFDTPGVAFFLRLPGPFDPVIAFEEMLTAARTVGGVLGGHLLDARRCDLTQQSIEHLREEMIEYRRRAQLAARQNR